MITLATKTIFFKLGFIMNSLEAKIKKINQDLLKLLFLAHKISSPQPPLPLQ